MHQHATESGFHEDTPTEAEVQVPALDRQCHPHPGGTPPLQRCRWCPAGWGAAPWSWRPPRCCTRTARGRGRTPARCRGWRLRGRGGGSARNGAEEGVAQHKTTINPHRHQKKNGPAEDAGGKKCSELRTAVALQGCVSETGSLANWVLFCC